MNALMPINDLKIPLASIGVDLIKETTTKLVGGEAGGLFQLQKN